MKVIDDYQQFLRAFIFTPGDPHIESHSATSVHKRSVKNHMKKAILKDERQNRSSIVNDISTPHVTMWDPSF